MDTNKLVSWAALAGVIILGAIMLFSPKIQGEGEMPVGTAGNLLAESYIPYVMYNDGYTSANGITLTGADGDLVVGGGSAVVTTTNTATSTLQVGCIQITATTTANPIKLLPATYATTTATFSGNTTGLPAVFVFGTCP